MNVSEANNPSQSANELGSNRTVTDQMRVRKTIDNWKRKLLDVSKRNRALNCKPNKITTVTIVEEQPAEVFRQLYIQDRAMGFRPASPNPELSLPVSTSSPTDNQEEEEADAFGQSLDFIPYAADDLSEQYTD